MFIFRQESHANKKMYISAGFYLSLHVFALKRQCILFGVFFLSRKQDKIIACLNHLLFLIIIKTNHAF